MKDKIIQVSGFSINSGSVEYDDYMTPKYDYLLVGVTESGDVVMSTGDGKWTSVGPKYSDESGS